MLRRGRRPNRFTEPVVSEREKSRILVGVIGKPRGNRGEVYVEPLTDFPDRRFAQAAELYFEPGMPGGGEPRRVVVEQSRWIGDRLVIRLAGSDSIDGAEALRGAKLYADAADEPSLDKGSYFHRQLEGLTVVTEDGRRLGTVTGLLRTAAGDILEVSPGEGPGEDPYLVPAVEEICYDVELSEGVIRVRLPEGLLEINR